MRLSRRFYTKNKVLFCLVLLTSCANLRLDKALQPSSTEWVMFGGNIERTNCVHDSLLPPLEILWEYNPPAGISAMPLICDSVIILGTLRGDIQLIDLMTGKVLAHTSMPSAIVGTPILIDNNLIVPLSVGDKTLISIDLISGDQLWDVSLGGIESSLLLVDDRLYVTTLEGSVYCLNHLNGEVFWKFDTQNKLDRKPIRSTPSTDGLRIFFGGDDGFIYALDKNNGMLHWKYKTGGSLFAAPLVIANNVIIGSLDGLLYCLDAVTGGIHWKYNTGAKIYTTASTNEKLVFLGTSNGMCHALDIHTGTQKWIFNTRSIISNAPLVVGNLLYFGSLDKTLYALDAKTGNQTWTWKAEGRIRISPVIWQRVLLVTFEDRTVIAFRKVGLK